MKLYFVGAGKMATALAGGIVRKGLYSADELCSYDVFESARQAFTAATGVECEPTPSKITEADVVLLAVKPQVAEQAVKALPSLQSDVLVISICAGVPICKISTWFHTDNVIRVMPNTPLMVGSGASCYALGKAVSAESAKLAEDILGSLGLVRKVQEEQLDAVTALSGSGPAYFFEMVSALTEAGQHIGLTHELALELSVQTMAGAAEMLKRNMGTPDGLRDAVTSPHGTTAAGLDVMKAASFRKMVDDVVKAARNRSIELGRQ